MIKQIAYSISKRLQLIFQILTKKRIILIYSKDDNDKRKVFINRNTFDKTYNDYLMMLSALNIIIKNGREIYGEKDFNKFIENSLKQKNNEKQNSNS